MSDENLFRVHHFCNKDDIIDVSYLDVLPGQPLGVITHISSDETDSHGKVSFPISRSLPGDLDRLKKEQVTILVCLCTNRELQRYTICPTTMKKMLYERGIYLIWCSMDAENIKHCNPHLLSNVARVMQEIDRIAKSQLKPKVVFNGRTHLTIATALSCYLASNNQKSVSKTLKDLKFDDLIDLEEESIKKFVELAVDVFDKLPTATVVTPKAVRLLAATFPLQKSSNMAHSPTIIYGNEHKPEDKSMHKWKIYVRRYQGDGKFGKKDNYGLSFIKSVTFIIPVEEGEPITVHKYPYTMEGRGWATFVVEILINFHEHIGKSPLRLEHELCFEKDGDSHLRSIDDLNRERYQSIVNMKRKKGWNQRAIEATGIRTSASNNQAIRKAMRSTLHSHFESPVRMATSPALSTPTATTTTTTKLLASPDRTNGTPLRTSNNSTTTTTTTTTLSTPFSTPNVNSSTESNKLFFHLKRTKGFYHSDPEGSADNKQHPLPSASEHSKKLLDIKSHHNHHYHHDFTSSSGGKNEESDNSTDSLFAMMQKTKNINIHAKKVIHEVSSEDEDEDDDSDSDDHEYADNTTVHHPSTKKLKHSTAVVTSTSTAPHHPDTEHRGNDYESSDEDSEEEDVDSSRDQFRIDRVYNIKPEPSASDADDLDCSRDQPLSSSETRALRGWLEGIGQTEHTEIFIDNQISVNLLPCLTVSDLAEMGITEASVREKIMLSIHQIENDGAFSGFNNWHHHTNSDTAEIATNSRVAQHREISYKEIQLNPTPISRGAFGVVYKGLWRGQEIAVKKLHVYLDENMLEDFRKEASLMERLNNHPAVVFFVGICTEPEHLCFITKYYPKGSAYDLLIKEKLHVDWKLIVKFTKDAASGIYHLHKERIIHCDIAARNILIAEDWSGCVGDFGMSRVKKIATRELHKSAKPTIEGPFRWMAPELLRSRDRYSFESDAWSFGVTLWEFVCREKPYKDLTREQVRDHVLAGNTLPIPCDCPDVFASLMRDCWREPHLRPSFDKIWKRLYDYYSCLCNLNG